MAPFKSCTLIVIFIAIATLLPENSDAASAEVMRCFAQFQHFKPICAKDDHEVYVKFNNLCSMHYFNCVTKRRFAFYSNGDCLLDQKSK